MPEMALRAQVAQALQLHAVHDPYILVFGPDNLDVPGVYVVRIVLAVPEDKLTDCFWTASSLERAREMLPAALMLWPTVRTTPQPGLQEQWCLER
jgi:hypothetical protein